MGINGPSFIFNSSGYRSPLGTSMPSGSYSGNRAYWNAAGAGGGGYTSISIRDYNFGTCGYSGGYGMGYGTGYGMGYGMPGYYGGYYGCGGGGISDKDALTAMGIGAGIGLLASPLGKPIVKGIGQGFKYLGLGLGYAGKYIGLGAAWAGKQLWKGACWTASNVIAPAAVWTGKQIGNAFAWLGKALFKAVQFKNPFKDNKWDVCGANK